MIKQSPVGHGQVFPLTHPQKRIWYIENIYPGTSLYNIVGSVIIQGALDFRLLEQAVRLTIRRHDILRLRLLERDGEAVQYVSADEGLPPSFTDFSIYEDPRAEFERWVLQETKKLFPLQGGPLCDFPLFRISDREAGFLVKFHHIISDGWSSNVIISDICSAYAALARGEAPDETPAPSYLLYLDHERSYLESERFAKNRSFWNAKFRELPEELLSYSSDDIAGARRTYQMDPELSLRIKEFVSTRKCSVNAFFVLLYGLFVSKTSGQPEVALGTPVLNRSGQKEKRMAGMFTSTMPFRCSLHGGQSVAEAMGRLQQELTECYFHQRYPYDLLIQDLELKKQGFDNLFNICVNYYNTRVTTDINGMAVEVIERYSGYQIYSQQLVIKDWSETGGLTIDIDYKTADYTEAQIDDMYERLLHLSRQMLDNPEGNLAEVSLLTEEERRWQLKQFNATAAEYPKDSSIDRLFEEQAERTPERTALEFQGESLTYRELNERSNALARLLQIKGVRKETFVGVLTRHSLETVVAIMAVIKAGGTYLPLEPTYPEERIRYMLDDSGCRLLLTNLPADELPAFAGEVVDLTDDSVYEGPVTNLGVEHGPGDLVYIIYTSGSTGKPKGAMIEHRGLVNYIWWAKLMYVRQEQEIFPLYSSLAFDLTVTSIFTPLISGGTIHVYRDDADEYVLYRIMRDNKATVVKLTPAHLALLKDTDYRHSTVSRFIVGGEDLRVSLAASIHEGFGGRIEICNEYGPTETVVGCMIHVFDPQRDCKSSVPIGIPAHNVQIYILDSGLNPVPVNTIGEMYISGDGIARGYWNREDLTAERFMDNPFLPGQRMYRTGDLAKLLDSGLIEYAGRVDHQVKIRGYRIELGEIEKLVSQQGSIKDVVVIDREHTGGGKYLCAYIVKHREVPVHELRSYLLERLPDYMVPAYFVELDEIPLNANGKVNRALLPEPSSAANSGREAFAASHTDEEKLLTSVLSEVLHTPQVGLTDNFYHLGGDSIKAIQAASKLKHAGYTMRVKHILSNPVIETMLAFMEPDEGSAIDQTPSKGTVGETPITSWFFALGLPHPEHYNQSVLLRLMQMPDPGELAGMLDALVAHHDSLRLNVDAVSGQLRYNEEPQRCVVEVHDLSQLSEDEQLEQLARRGEALKASMNLHSGLLFKGSLFDLGSKGARLLLTAHHLVVDGISWRVLLEDLEILMTAQAEGKPFSLAAKTNSFQLWSDYVQKHSESALKEYPYWSSVLAEEKPLPLGTAGNGSAEATGSGTAQRPEGADSEAAAGTAGSSLTVSAQLTSEETQQLLTQAGTAYGTEPRELLAAALAAAIGETFGVSEAVVELEGHGREELGEPLDISRTVGWFTSIYPVRLKVQGGGAAEQIKATKEQLRTLPRKGIGYGLLAYLTQTLPAEPNRRRIRFNYLGDFDATFSGTRFTLSQERSGAESSPSNPLTALLDINAMITGGQLDIEVTYSPQQVPSETAKRFVSSLAVRLQELIRHCCGRDEVEFTPSDFETLDISQDELDSLLL